MLLMDISVLAPVYNVEKYLKQCLTSIPHNELDMEIICINDGSTDDSLAILNDLARDDDRIIVIDKKNEGYGASLNRGINKARGRYVGIVETDDFLDGDMFHALFDLAKKHDYPDVVKSAYLSVNDTNDADKRFCDFKNRICTSQQPFRIEDEPLLLRYHPSIWSAIYRKDFLDTFNIRFKEVEGGGWVDNPFLIDTLCQARGILYTDEAFYCYRENRTGSSTTSLAHFNVPLDRWNDMTDALERIGVNDRRIWDIQAFRCLYNLRAARRAENFVENRCNWYKRAAGMAKRLPITCFVRALRYINWSGKIKN